MNERSDLDVILQAIEASGRHLNLYSGVSPIGFPEAMLVLGMIAGTASRARAAGGFDWGAVDEELAIILRSNNVALGTGTLRDDLRTLLRRVSGQ